MKSAFSKINERAVGARTSVVLGLILCSASVMLSGCGRDRNQRVLEYMPQMTDTPAVKAQRLGPFGVGMRVPPEGTLAINEHPYRFANDPEAAGRELKNPVPRTREKLLKGQHLFNTYCIVCHGPRGEGNGFVVPKFPMPPSLQSDKVRGWTDGRIYHVITAGQNLMPSYASQVNDEERWEIINYVRVLQRAQNPTEADIRELERERSGQ